MTEASIIVKDALQLCGQHSSISPSDPEQQSKGFDVLSDLISEWINDNYDIAVVQPYEIADDIGESQHMKQTITAILADKLAIYLQVDLDSGALALIKLAKERMLRYMPDPDIQYTQGTPIGQGNRGTYRSPFYQVDS